MRHLAIDRLVRWPKRNETDECPFSESKGGLLLSEGAVVTAMATSRLRVPASSCACQAHAPIMLVLGTSEGAVQAWVIDVPLRSGKIDGDSAWFKAGAVALDELRAAGGAASTALAIISEDLETAAGVEGQNHREVTIPCV